MTSNKIYKITIADLIMLNRKSSKIKASVKKGELIRIEFSSSETYTGIVLDHDKDSILLLTKDTNKLKWFSKNVKVTKL